LGHINLLEVLVEGLGDLATACIAFILRHRRKFTGGIYLISESGAYLDVSFLALSEDKFFTVTKKMGERQVMQGTL